MGAAGAHGGGDGGDPAAADPAGAGAAVGARSGVSGDRGVFCDRSLAEDGAAAGDGAPRHFAADLPQPQLPPAPRRFADHRAGAVPRHSGGRADGFAHVCRPHSHLYGVLSGAAPGDYAGGWGQRRAAHPAPGHSGDTGVGAAHGLGATPPAAARGDRLAGCRLGRGALCRGGRGLGAAVFGDSAVSNREQHVSRPFYHEEGALGLQRCYPFWRHRGDSTGQLDRAECRRVGAVADSADALLAHARARRLQQWHVQTFRHVAGSVRGGAHDFLPSGGMPDPGWGQRRCGRFTWSRG